MKKLTLNRETLRLLSEPHAREAMGGAGLVISLVDTYCGSCPDPVPVSGKPKCKPATEWAPEVNGRP